MPETISATRTVPFSSLRGFPDLFSTYCSDFEDVASHFAGDFRSRSAQAESAKRRADFVSHRREVVEALREQQEDWGLDEATRRNLRRLADPASAAVVTGQQIGLFGGPLYTVYKTITAVQLADRLERETGRPTVAIFWMAGEDHDFDEIAELGLARRNDPFTIRFGADDGEAAAPPDRTVGIGGPVGRIRVDEALTAFVDRIGEELLDTDFTADLLDGLHDAYREGDTLLAGFARFLNGLFPERGLILVSPDDRALKRLTRPLFRREIREADRSYTLLSEVSEELEDGYHAQIHPRSTNLFLLDGSARRAIDRTEDGSFRLAGSEERVSEAELLDLLDEHPERFSPNVALRPLMQDLLLPTAAYVGGPSEISYFAQLKPLYEWAEIPMPLVYPRASGAVVEGKIRSVLEKYDLSAEDLQDDLGALFKQVILARAEVDLESEFSESVRFLHEAINHLKPVAEEVDQTLVPATEAARSDLMKTLDHLKDKFVRAEKRKHEEIRSQLQKARVGLYPDGRLQERFLSVLYFLNKYSSGVVRDLEESFSLDTTSFQIVDL